MSGQIKIRSAYYKLSKHDHIQITLETKNKKIYTIIYNDPRRFGYIDYFSINEINNHFLLKKLGVEPLSDDFTFEYLKKKLVKNQFQ